MCLATPVKVKKVEGGSAFVEHHHGKYKLDISLLQDIKKGDYLLAHSNLAIQKIPSSEAKKILNLVHQYNHQIGHSHHH